VSPSGLMTGSWSVSNADTGRQCQHRAALPAGVGRTHRLEATVRVDADSRERPVYKLDQASHQCPTRRPPSVRRCKGSASRLSQRVCEAGGSSGPQTHLWPGSSPDRVATGRYCQTARFRLARRRGCEQGGLKVTLADARSSSMILATFRTDAGAVAVAKAVPATGCDQADGGSHRSGEGRLDAARVDRAEPRPRQNRNRETRRADPGRSATGGGPGRERRSRAGAQSGRKASGGHTGPACARVAA